MLINFNFPGHSCLVVKHQLTGWLPMQKPSILINTLMLALPNHLQKDRKGISVLPLDCTATHFAIIPKAQEQPKP